MADAKKTTKTTIATKTSKRKITGGKKTTRVKTKVPKKGVQGEEPETDVLLTEETSEERLVTARRQRVLEKAKAKSETVAVAEPEEEVQAVKITDVSGIVYDKSDYDAMVEMYDATIKAIREGEIVRGTVIGVNPDDVFVDVGFKSEGRVPLSEFPQPLNIKVGDPVDVFLEQIEDSNGQLLLSKQKADFMLVWDKIRDLHDAGETVQGRVMRRIKGGVIVDIMGVDAFLPAQANRSRTGPCE